MNGIQEVSGSIPLISTRKDTAKAVSFLLFPVFCFPLKAAKKQCFLAAFVGAAGFVALGFMPRFGPVGLRPGLGRFFVVMLRLLTTARTLR